MQDETQVVVRDGGRVIARIIPTPDPEEARRQFFAQVDALRLSFADLSTRELNRLADRAVRDVRKARRRRTTDAAGTV